MYVDKKKKNGPLYLTAAILFIIAILLWNRTSIVSGKDIQEGSAAALEEAVQRSALQCYVVEGIYPPSLNYLEDHYGLQVNHEKFYISYDIFASNLPPDVRVVPRGK